MTVNLGVQQLVTGPTKTSRAISIDIEGDNLLLELEEAGRMVLPMKEATPRVEEVELDYGSNTKIEVRNEPFTVVEEEASKSHRTKRFIFENKGQSTLMSSYGMLFLVVGVTTALVGTVAAVRATLSRSRRKSEVISYA